MNPTRLAIGLCLAAPLFLTGCFYGQALGGQVSLLSKREPIEKVLASEDTPERLRIQLEEVLALRRFAAEELVLPVGKSYASFVELEGEHVIWNVFAAPEFSIEPKTWCYPVLGCASYRGYFAEADAERYAARLETDGYDVYVAGIDAYSTLGWFDDAVLSSFVYRPRHSLADLLFHELAHRELYVKGDTSFNESFATTVGREGLRRWLDGSKQPELFEKALAQEARHARFVELVTRYRKELETLYAGELEEEALRAEKERAVEALRGDYRTLRESWGGYAGYDRWFAEPINNAKLSTVSTYNEFVPGFLALFEAEGQDFESFYKACRALSQEVPEERARRLRALASGDSEVR